MKRCHAFEFNDYKMVPEFISDSMPETWGFPLCYYVFKQVPSDQAVIHDGVELTGHVWIRPAEAIKQYEQ